MRDYTHINYDLILIRHEAYDVTLLHGSLSDLQIIMLIPLGVKSISHSICRVALS